MVGVRAEADLEDVDADEAPGVEARRRITLLSPELAGDGLELLTATLTSRFDLSTRRPGAQVALPMSASVVGLTDPVLLVPSTVLGASSVELLRELHEAPRLEPLSVLVFTQDPAEVARFLDAGADDVLHPAMHPRELLSRVERAARKTEYERYLFALAQTDALTGLANYRALRVRLEEEFKRATRYGHPLAAVAVDLDHLKAINDGLGHELGNRAIQAFSSHLIANLREVDFAARFGGDEFVVLLPHQTAEDARVFAERLRKGLETVRVKQRDGTPVSIVLTLSAGIADHRPPEGRDGPDALLRAADRALYLAKREGRNRVELDQTVEH